MGIWRVDRLLLKTVNMLSMKSVTLASVIGALLAVLIAVVDVHTGRYAAFYVIYMMLVILVTAAAGRWAGFFVGAAHPPQTSETMQTPSSAGKSLPARGAANWFVRRNSM